MKHSPGKWKVVRNIAAPEMKLDNCIMVECEQAPICLVTENWIPDGMNEANAKLIVQSPVMLSLLKEEVMCLDGWIDRLQGVGLMCTEMQERKEFILMTIKNATT